MKKTYQVILQNPHTSFLLKTGNNRITLSEDTQIEILSLNEKPLKVLHTAIEDDQLIIQLDNETTLTIENYNQYSNSTIYYLSETSEVVTLNIPEHSPVLAEEIGNKYKAGAIPWLIGGAATTAGIITLLTKEGKDNSKQSSPSSSLPDTGNLSPSPSLPDIDNPSPTIDSSTYTDLLNNNEPEKQTETINNSTSTNSTPTTNPPAKNSNIIVKDNLNDNLDDNNNTFVAPKNSDEHYIINGMGGDDHITTGTQTDIVRGGIGKDHIYTSESNDAVVIVGITKDIEYNDYDISNAAGSGYDLSKVVSLEELENKTQSDIAEGEIYDGQEGNNTLITYGYVDVTKTTLRNFLFIRSEKGTLKISVEQLEQLSPRIISSDNANLVITADNKPKTVDLSNVNVHLFKSITIEEGITLILNERSLYETDYLAGKGILQIIPNNPDEIPDLTGKIVSVTILDQQGNEISAEQHNATVVPGNLIIGSAESETITGTNLDDRLFGSEGDDTLIGGAGNDILRGGKGNNILDGGEGDDKFIVVGNLLAGGKINNDADNDVLGFPIESLNGHNWKEAEGKQIIRGGEGYDTLYVIGTADISHYQLEGIEKIEIRSDVTFDVSQLIGSEVSGDGSSIIRIKDNSNAETLNTLHDLTVSNIRQIHIEKGVVFEVKNPSELGSALILTGEGTIRFTEPVGQLSSEYSITSGLNIEDVNGSVNLDAVRKLNNIEYASHLNDDHQENVTDLLNKQRDLKDHNIKFNLEGTDGNDYIEGSQYNDFIDGKEGDDILSGKEGSDVFSISNSRPAKKTIVDKSQDDDPNAHDTLYLANAKGAANLDLGKFSGTIGGNINSEGQIENPITEIEIGHANTGGLTKAISSKTNILLIIDNSGSMGGSRMSKAKDAAIQLLEKYANQGDISARIIAFNSSAYHSFNNYDGWLNKDDAIKAINSIYAGGGTNYYSALNSAEQIFTQNQSNIYHPDGNNMSFFLSDGEPDYRISPERQAQWEQFTKSHKILSHAIGFGGLLSIEALEAIAYDGKNDTDIQPILEENLSKLDQTVTELAKTDFIENVIGTDFDDHIVGNGLDNYLYGGKGDDVLDGAGGKYNRLSGGEGIDTAKFAGNRDEYEITYEIEKALIKHKPTGQINEIDRSIEKLKFADTDIEDTKFPEIKGIDDPFPNLLMAKFANAAYVSDSGVDDLAELKNDHWLFLTAQHFADKHSEEYAKLSPYFGNNGKETPYFEFGGKTLKEGKIVSLHSDGNIHKIYEENEPEVKENSDLEGRTKQGSPIDGSSAAIVAVKGDTLVLSFRGTEEPVIWKDNLPKNPKKWGNIAPIIREIFNEIFALNNITSPTDNDYKSAVNHINDLLISSDLGGVVGGAAVGIGSLITSPKVMTEVLLVLKKLETDKLIQLAKLSPNEYIDTDSTGWINPEKHYAGYKELLSHVKNYVIENNIQKVFVTGHSLGGAMTAWFMTDEENGAKAEAYQNIEITAIPYAAPGIVSKNVYHALSDKTNWVRFEASNDVVPDTTDLVAQAQEDMKKNNPLRDGLKISQLGEQYNAITHSRFEYSEKVAGEIHAMKNNYFTAIQLLEDVGFNEDLNFIKHHTNAFRKNTKGIHSTNPDYRTFLEEYDPVIMRQVENINQKMQQQQKKTGKGKYYDDIFNNEHADITGDQGGLLFGKREFIVAEKYSENDIIIGSRNNDRLIGDADFMNSGEIGWKGTNDIFYIGQGKDTVYGDQTGGLFSGKSDDDGGIDTVVYKFSDTLISKGMLNNISVGGKQLAHTHGNQIILNIDGTEDTLYDIEYLHFIDKPSDGINLLAGSDGNDVIKGFGGNDFLFGADGYDLFIENRDSGNDRIHGGRGNDSVYYEGVNITSISIKDRVLVVDLDDGSTDYLYSIEGISANNVSKTTQEWIMNSLNLTDQKLLALYKPIFNYENGDADDLKVFGKVIRDNTNKITGLDYELREKDLGFIDPDDSWWVHISLGEDLLPTYYYTEASYHTDPDNQVQIRNAFDPSLKFAGTDNNHVMVYLDIDSGGAYLNEYKDFANAKAKGETSKLDNYSIELTGIKENHWDFGDHHSSSWERGKKSSDYEQSTTPKLAGLPSGQMEMGFLFQNTAAAKLGYFDLLGEPMNHSGVL